MQRNPEGRTSGLKAWLPLLVLAGAVFCFNSSEFMPIGLLSDIGEDLGVANSTMGLLITVYAWVVCLMSVPLMVVCSRLEYRNLLLGTIALFAISHVGSALSASYGFLMASRIGVACAHSVFWSIAPPIAVKLAPEGKRAAALSLIATSTSVALILGLPIGRAIGLAVGWRATFGIVAAISFAILAFLALSFPKMPNTSYVPPSKVPEYLSNPALVGIFGAVALTILAQFTGYSYIEPFLKTVARMPDALVTWVLCLYGAAGIAASVLFSKFFERHKRAFANAAIPGIGIVLLLLLPASASWWTMTAAVLLWGMALTIFNLTLQSLEIEAAPPAAVMVATAAYSGIYNFGIGTGAAIGGVVERTVSVAWIGIAGAAIALAAMLWYRKVLFPRIRELL